MDTKRQQRLESLLNQELGSLIMKEVEIPPGALVSIGYIDLSSDSKNAKIGVSVYPEDKAEEMLEVLNRESGRLHYKLIRILNIRTVPALKFMRDTGSQNAAAVEKAFLDDGVDKEA